MPMIMLMTMIDEMAGEWL